MSKLYTARVAPRPGAISGPIFVEAETLDEARPLLEEKCPKACLLVTEPEEVTLGHLYEKLERHDWFSCMSDDHRVYMAGERAKDELNMLVEHLGEPGKALRRAYADHVYWCVNKEGEEPPKPPRP